MPSDSARTWFAASVILFGLAQTLPLIGQKKILPHFEKPPIADYAVLDAFATLSGARRFGADLAFIQFLHFIARPMEDVEMERKGLGHGHLHDHGQPLRESDIDEIKDFNLRSVYLDPYFHYSYLFGAGLLAFYLNRFSDALEIIQLGIERDPTYWRFRLYAGAIGYTSQNQTDKVIPLLEEAVQYPDCPVMVANILGNLYEMKGDSARAADVYRHILNTSRDSYDLFKARTKLEALQQKFGI